MSPSMIDRWLRPSALLLGQQGVWDGARMHHDFEVWCRGHQGHSCALWLSSTLLLELVCASDLPLDDDTAALAWAGALLQHYHGEAASRWPLAAWHLGQRRGVSVLHGVSLASLRAAARSADVRLQAVRPWWPHVLSRALRRHTELQAGRQRLAVVEGRCLVSIDLQEGRLARLHLHYLDDATPEALRQTLAEQNPAPTLAVGYGLAEGPLIEIQVPDPLHAAAPASHWLAAGAR